MATTNYYSINGQIIGEKTAGSSRVDYLTDALGSVTATVDQSANVINTYRYKPYGGLLAKTGVGSDPAFQWVGSQGYRNTGKSYSDVYVRARHYSSGLGRWATAELQRIAMVNIYSYVQAGAVTFVDPSGLQRLPVPPQPPNAVRLSITLQGPAQRTTDCGGARFIVRWSISPARSGWLIQHIRAGANVVGCPDPNNPRRPPGVVDQFTCEYWELWHFIAGVPEGDGTDWFITNGYREQTSGHLGLRGSIKWRPEQNGHPPGNWRRGDDICPPHNISAGVLEWTTVRPPGWQDAVTPEHWLSAGWHCCDMNRFETQIAWQPRQSGTWPLEIY